ncbi:hypothetical protein EV179_004344 [Coemansia sp. RSA 487]|nr:hypothetical protein EV179_004344 [Coemansia sp. RSA 487]
MSSVQQQTLVTAEYPLTGDDIDQSSIPQRPGVTYTKTTVLIPSDMQLILIPSTIPVPTNDTITTFLLAPTNNAKRDNDKRVTNAGASISAAAHIPAVVAKDTQQASSTPSIWLESAISVPGESGSFIRLPSSNATQNKPTQSGVNVLGVEHPGDPFSVGWMMAPAVLEEASPEGETRDYVVSTGTPVGYFNSEDDGQDVDDLGSQVYSEAPSTNTGRSSQQPQQHPLAVETRKRRSGSRKRPLEDPDGVEMERPKKPRNSFFFFRCEFHKRMNAKGERLKAKNISGVAADEWNAMPDHAKEMYKELAAEDTLRYKRAIKIYKELAKQDNKKLKVSDSSSDKRETQNVQCSAAVPNIDLNSNYSAKISQPNETPASLSAGTSDSTVCGFDVASFISRMPTVTPADAVHTSPLFNEPTIISADPNAVSSPENSAQPAKVSIDYGNQQTISAVSSTAPLAAVSASPLVNSYIASSPISTIPA